MKTTNTRLGATIMLLAGLALSGCDDNPVGAAMPEETGVPVELAATSQPIPVSGSVIHYASEAIVHSQEPTDNGMIQRSTDIVEFLTGDLTGYVLFHVTSVFDYADGTLVNTGTQLFSGTVAGSTPVILHDDSFRFEVDLATGVTTGEIHLGRSKDAPHQGGWYECDLEPTGTVVTPDGDNLTDYSGVCTPRGNVGG
ncbi:MAG: hypothetical protein R3181_06335 [Rubricoccaceae bacterium]|nr:hypothetical protein [Rubricoccaceae bacterium]